MLSTLRTSSEIAAPVIATFERTGLDPERCIIDEGEAALALHGLEVATRHATRVNVLLHSTYFHELLKRGQTPSGILLAPAPPQNDRQRLISISHPGGEFLPIEGTAFQGIGKGLRYAMRRHAAEAPAGAPNLRVVLPTYMLHELTDSTRRLSSAEQDRVNVLNHHFDVMPDRSAVETAARTA